MAIDLKKTLRDVFGRFTNNPHKGYHETGSSPFYDILVAARNKGLTPGLEMAARKWMRDQAKNILVPNDSMALISKEKDMVRRELLVGFMYMFQYDAKTKDELPYWDKFPLIFPFAKTEDGFIGINLHYLPRPLRARLMDALYSLTINRKFNDNQRLAITYQVLKSSADFAPFKPCVKRYLNSHVRSKFYKVPSEKWDVALMLPLERFQKASKTKVWEDSTNKIKKATR